MIKTPTKRIVDNKRSLFNSKVVEVKSPYGMVDEQMYYICICEDGTGGGMLPENILKPINKK